LAEEPTQIDLGPFLAAIIENAGGEIRIPYGILNQQNGDRAIAIDIEDEGMTLVLSIVNGEDIPSE
jgi:hypothetical protein